MSQIAYKPGDRDAGYRYYSLEEIAALIERAQAMGLNVEIGSELEKLTIEELETLVTKIN